jgi:hypothetical protein
LAFQPLLFRSSAITTAIVLASAIPYCGCSLG